MIGNFTGEANFLDQKECMAANPRIYGQLVPLLHKYSKFASAEEKQHVDEALRLMRESAQEVQANASSEDAPL